MHVCVCGVCVCLDCVWHALWCVFVCLCVYVMCHVCNVWGCAVVYAYEMSDVWDVLCLYGYVVCCECVYVCVIYCVSSCMCVVWYGVIWYYVGHIYHLCKMFYCDIFINVYNDLWSYALLIPFLVYSLSFLLSLSFPEQPPFQFLALF